MISTIRKLNQILIRKEKLQLLVLFFVITIMAFTQALGVASVMPFIGLVINPGFVFENRWLAWAYSFFRFENTQSFVIAVGIAMFAVIIFSNAISALATWMKIRLAWSNSHRLSLRLLEKYLSMPYAYFLNQHSADLSKNVLGEVKQLTSSYILPLLMLITKAMIVAFMLALLFLVDVGSSLMAIFVLGGVYAAIFFGINKKLKHRGALRMRSNKMRFKVVGEAFGGIKEIKVMRREKYFLKKYAQASKENIRHLSWSALVGLIPKFALEALAFGGITFFILLLLYTGGDVGQVVPMVALFALAGYRILPAFQQIFSSFTQMQFNQAVLERIHRDITGAGQAACPEAIYPKELPEPIPFRKEIRLQKLTYSYPRANTPVVADLNLVISHHTSVALVGATGAGKTTIADIILGLLTPQAGNLTVDGLPVNQDNILSWQLNLGYVPQHIYLMDDTVARNIAFGLADKDINRETLAKVAQVANIYDFITQELPNGFDTLVGERGIRLSGGQRQRIGIARALYHDPEVVVFDEATSALDGVTENAVLCAMENAARLKTLIVIAHRLTTVKNCDVIYMVDKGKIADSGTYDDLLKSNSQFQSMAKLK